MPLLERALEAHGSGGAIWDRFFLAMALERAGRSAEARARYDSAVELLTTARDRPKDSALSPRQLLELRLLHGEAKGVFGRGGGK